MPSRFRKPSKPFVLKNIKPKEFQALLARVGACDTARKWAEKKSLKTVLKTCNYSSWLNWLFAKLSVSGEHLDFNSYPARILTITEAEAKAWGGEKHFQRADAHAEHVLDSVYRKLLKKAQAGRGYISDSEWDTIEKAGSDVYRQYYVVE